MRKSVILAVVLVLAVATASWANGIRPYKDSPDVTATALSPTEVLVEWEPMAGETKNYTVFRSTPDHPNSRSAVGTVSASVYDYLDTSVRADRTYLYSISPWAMGDQYRIEPQFAEVTTPAKESDPKPEFEPESENEPEPTEEPEVTEPEETTTTTTPTETRITIGADKMQVNGQIVPLDTPAKVENDRTLLPLRAIAEALGANVEWDEDTKTVIIVQER